MKARRKAARLLLAFPGITTGSGQRAIGHRLRPSPPMSAMVSPRAPGQKQHETRSPRFRAPSLAARSVHVGWRICATVLIFTSLLACDPRGERSLLLLEPAYLPDCSAPGVITVNWKADPRQNESVRLEVSRLGKPGKLWVIGPPEGSDATGPWVDDGTTISLLTHDGKLLARQTVTSEGCRMDDGSDQ
ncbi:MAG: hypothetical protein WDA70_04950 [Lysobacteraceae bacterium]